MGLNGSKLSSKISRKSFFPKSVLSLTSNSSKTNSNTETESISSKLTSDFTKLSNVASSSSLSNIGSSSSASSSDENQIEINLSNFCERIEELSISVSNTKEVHGCYCDICDKSEFTEYRYKCLICEDYDLCGKCFEKRKTNQQHMISHPVVRFDVPGEISGLRFENCQINLSNFEKRFQNEIHEEISCNICLMKPLKGIRFKCDTCNDYNLCFDCYSEKKFTLKHSFYDHPCIVLVKSQSFEIDVDQIEFIAQLGNGAFGTVYKSKLKNLNKIVACKVITIKKEQDNLMKFLKMDPIIFFKSYIQEKNAYKELQGVNILKMFGYCIQKTEKALNLMIITEYMGKGSLKNLLENETNLSFRRKFDIVCDIVAGMTRIHEHQFIHRDIRPDNILIDSNYVAKIGDMGIAKLIETDQNTQIGCQSFMPPEFYLGKYDQKLDVFTFGLTMNIIYSGKHEEKNPIIITKDAEIFCEFINVLVSHEPDKRPTSKTINYKFRLIKKIFDTLIFSKEIFSLYAKKSTTEKNHFFKSIYDKMRDKIALKIEF